MRPDEPVSRIMTETVVVVDAQRAPSEALECFRQYPIHHLPVVRDGRLAGMLSSVDLRNLEALVPRTAADRGAWLDERVTIDQLMRAPAVSVRPHSSLAEAAQQMMNGGVHAAPVVDDADRVIGIVTTSDIMRCFLHGPPRRGQVAQPRPAVPAANEEADAGVVYRQRPTDEEYATALRTAELLHVEARDLRFLGKSLLYLDQRRRYLEKVVELADRFLLTGQDEHTHALLLKAIHACKRAEESATGRVRAPFPLE